MPEPMLPMTARFVFISMRKVMNWKVMNWVVVGRMRGFNIPVARRCTPIRLDAHRSPYANLPKKRGVRPAQLAILAAVAMFIAVGHHAVAKDGRERSVESVASRTAG